MKKIIIPMLLSSGKLFFSQHSAYDEGIGQSINFGAKDLQLWIYSLV
jgi:hypothetical protein